jgi:hypothetical protein
MSKGWDYVSELRPPAVLLVEANIDISSGGSPVRSPEAVPHLQY